MANRAGGAFAPIAELRATHGSARVYAEGYQSWSPTRSYRLDETPYRPSGDPARLAHYRPEASAPKEGFQGAGLLAVQPEAGAAVHVFALRSAAVQVPLIRARSIADDRIEVSANGSVEHIEDAGPGGLEAALARWGDGFARQAGVVLVRPAPTAWCTWYHYFTEVSEAGVLENLEQMDRLGLPIDVVQVDDGWQRGIGDWMPPTRFASVPALIDRVRQRGRRAGLWLAPFLAGSGSDLIREHPDWLVRDSAGTPVPAGRNWEQELYGLDLTHPGVASYLAEVFSTCRAWGVDYFKIDFVFAGALPGVRHAEVSPIEAYRAGLDVIRSAIGPGAYLLGCGAPVLPSVGIVDAMRVSPDTAPHWEPMDGDIAEPGARSAVITGAARAWQHGRLWVNDPDCLIVRPAVERRAEWADHVERYGGLRASSDRLAELDAWGLRRTRQILEAEPPAHFVTSSAQGSGG